MTVRVHGVIYTGRTLSEIDSEIPDNLESPLEAAAWVSYVLRPYRRELEPLPEWFVQGERHWDLVPPAARELLEAQRRQQTYEASPKCFIDRDYARPLRRHLDNEISWLREETEMTLSFDRRVLTIEISGRLYEVLASGESWPSSYKVAVSQRSKLPARFMDSTVVVSVFDGHVRLDGHALGPCEAVS